MPGPAPQMRRVLRHLAWVRSQGLARLIEEDELNPVAKIRIAADRARWVRSNPVPAGSAVPVFLFGVQRSGTNMVARGFRSSPEFEVFNENDKRAFTDFRIRPVDQIAPLVVGSRHRWILFKPLCDSHRAVELLEQLGDPVPGRALWVYRWVDPRVRSALAKFGDANLKALSQIAAGRTGGLWQAGGLSEQNVKLVSSFDFDTMSPASAAALFWFIRNSLFFELGLDRRSDVLPVSYDRLIKAPDEVTQQICTFLGCPWDRRFAEHIEPRHLSEAPDLEIDLQIRSLCEELQARFDSL